MIDPDKIRTYQSLRQIGREFHGKVLKMIPKDILVSTAQELGLWKSGILVGHEGDTDVLADRLIYDRRWEGKNSLQHLEASNAAVSLTEDERRFFEAMRTGRFSLFQIADIYPGSHALLADRLMEVRTGLPKPCLELIDLGLSQTGIPGALLATRLLDAGGFFMTSGVSFPFTADREKAIMAYLREKEFGYREKRLDLAENYSLYFFRLHRHFGVEVMYGANEDE